MLTVSKALSAGQAQSYHQLEYTSETQSYYKQGGVVSAADFARLTEGQHPETGEQLVKHRVSHEYANADGTTTKSVEHRAGCDATFSAPKSVSLTALVGGDERVREAHRVAVITALNELERYTQARIGGNALPEKTGQFIVAKFEHDTARPVDGYAAPQLHTHAIIFNMTQRADGSTRALQEKSFFDSQNFATAVYQSSLMHQLRNLGYEIYREQIRQLRQASSVEDVVEMDERALPDTTVDIPLDTDVVFLSGNAFPFFGVPAMLGRTFLPSDNPEGQAPQPVAVLTYQYWRKRFNGNPAIVGKSLRLGGSSYTILGVMPRSFTWWDTDVYAPLDTSAASAHSFMTILRIKRGYTKVQAQPRFSRSFSRWYASIRCWNNQRWMLIASTSALNVLLVRPCIYSSLQSCCCL